MYCPWGRFTLDELVWAWVKAGGQKLIPELLGERLKPSLGLSILGVHRVEVLEIDERR
jgi:hypothetical protein